MKLSESADGDNNILSSSRPCASPTLSDPFHGKVNIIKSLMKILTPLYLISIFPASGRYDSHQKNVTLQKPPEFVAKPQPLPSKK